MPKPHHKPPPQLLSRRAVAELLSLHPATLRRWHKSKRLCAIALSPRCVRYREEDVENLLARYHPETVIKPGPKPRTNSNRPQ
jgi:predicted site-specific integrase-resolvase